MRLRENDVTFESLICVHSSFEERFCELFDINDRCIEIEEFVKYKQLNFGKNVYVLIRFTLDMSTKLIWMYTT